MKKEKEIRINLPDGAEYRRVEVTDGGISSVKVLKAIPKPNPLVGGTEVYRKDNGYWYCRIKDGSDEFMHLYFGDLTAGDILYTEDGNERKFVTVKEQMFKTAVLNALKNRPKNGFRWIPVFEPSKTDGGNLQFVPGEKVLRGLSKYNWEKEFQNYAPENGSTMSSNTTYFLLLLRLLKDGFATIEQLADDSKEIGHYFDSEGSKFRREKTGERQFGGLCGFAGNTYKIVKYSKLSSVFAVLGGAYDDYGHISPLANVALRTNQYEPLFYSVGWLELTK